MLHERQRASGLWHFPDKKSAQRDTVFSRNAIPNVLSLRPNQPG